MNNCRSESLSRVIFSLGSNEGDRLLFIETACEYLSEYIGELRPSQLYETEPVNCPEGSPYFLNACVETYTDMPPEKVLELCMIIEEELSRTRNGIYGAPRTCDIDIIMYGEHQCQSPELTLPHPRAHEREFVLRPLCDIDPNLILPGFEKNVSVLLAELPKGPKVRLVEL